MSGRFGNACVSEDELYIAIRNVGEETKAFSYLHSRQRDEKYRELARLAWAQGPARALHQYLPMLREGLLDLYDLDDALHHKLDDPLEDIELREQRVIDAVCRLFHARYRTNLRNDLLALQRVADEAWDVADELEEAGKAELRLPYLTANEAGPCHCCVLLRLQGSTIEAAEWLQHTPRPKIFQLPPPDLVERALDLLLAHFKADTGVDLTTDHAAMNRLRDAAKRACTELKTRERTLVELPWITAERIERTDLRVELTRTMLGDAAPSPDPEPVPAPAAKPESGFSKVMGWIAAILVMVAIWILMYLLDL